MGILSLVLALAVVSVVYPMFIRPWHLRWGATDEEVHRTLLGDGLVPNPKLNVTHAVTIHAPVAEVWPWLVQMGQGRGGFYSYEWIENLMGLDIHNANRIVQEFQNLKVGDRIPLAPGGFGIPVAALEPGRAFVLHGDTRTDTFTIPITGPGDYFNVSWGFYLDEIDGRNARLIERWRVDWNPRPQNWMYIRAFLEPSAFLMERKMLLGIKQRAESFGRGSALPK